MLEQLINGSDIRGVAMAHEDLEVNLTSEVVGQLALGIVSWLIKERGLVQEDLTIAIGHDSRLSAEDLKAALITNFKGVGVKVIDVSLATTPAMFMATQFEDYASDAAIMITASHLPYYYNGLKLFTKAGGAEHEDIAQIVAYAQKAKALPLAAGRVKKRELMPRYAADLVTKIRQGIGTGEMKPLSGFHIIVDAGNGAGGFFAKEVLAELGADTTGSQFLTPDGRFPNHAPNPDNKAAMASIQGAVLANQADLGVIFDTDVDRSAVVAADGQVINRNNLIAVLAQIVLAEHPGTTIVTNSPTSSHLKTFIESLGGKQHRYISGYRNVINQAIKLNQAGIPTELAIETSGHAAFKENYFLDDGAYVIAKILMLLPQLKKEGKTLSGLIGSLQQPVAAQEVRFKIESDKTQAYGNQVIQELADFVATTPGFEVDAENEEGIRVNVSAQYGAGWYLLRMSLHEPLLVLQVENDQAAKNAVVFKKLHEFFVLQKELDLVALDKILAD